MSNDSSPPEGFADALELERSLADFAFNGPPSFESSVFHIRICNSLLPVLEWASVRYSMRPSSVLRFLAERDLELLQLAHEVLDPVDTEAEPA